MTKTNEFVATLTDEEVSKRIEQMRRVLSTVGNATTGEVVDELFPHLSNDDKFKIAILAQIIIGNMNQIKKGSKGVRKGK